MSRTLRHSLRRFVRDGAPGLPVWRLGKTGIELPILGFGTGASGQRLALHEAVRLYETAFQQGITYFDTAPEFAGYGKAQEQLGHFLPQVRPQIFLVTKCFEPDGERALRLLERNLRELRTDYADLVFVRSVGDDKMDPRVVFGKSGAYAGLMKAKSLGLTRLVGLSGHSRPARFVQAMRHLEIDVLLNAVNVVGSSGSHRLIVSRPREIWPLRLFPESLQWSLVVMEPHGPRAGPPA